MSSTQISANQRPKPINIDRSKIPDLLSPSGLARAEHATGSFIVWVDADVDRKRILTPSWWANHVAALKPGAQVTVMRRDMSMVLDMRVKHSAPGMVQFVILTEIGEDAPGVPATDTETSVPAIDNPDAYKVGFSQGGWYVQFNATGEMLKPASLKLTRLQAHTFANEHNKAANEPQQ